MMFKVLHGHVAITPEDLDLKLSDTRTRASHCWKLQQHRSNTKQRQNSFVSRTIPEWNRLPACAAEAGCCRPNLSLAPLPAPDQVLLIRCGHRVRPVSATGQAI